MIRTARMRGGLARRGSISTDSVRPEPERKPYVHHDDSTREQEVAAFVAEAKRRALESKAREDALAGEPS